jgi:glycerol uptake facilitator-like aquaporin
MRKSDAVRVSSGGGRRGSAGCEEAVWDSLATPLAFGIALLIVVSVANEERVHASLAPVAVGAALAVAAPVAGPAEGAVNPVRALGPAIIRRLADHPNRMMAPRAAGRIVAGSRSVLAQGRSRAVSLPAST